MDPDGTDASVLRYREGGDEQGRVVEPEVASTTAVVSYVKPFPYKIVPPPTGVKLLHQ
ncbi:hypothetical protein V5O48_009354 [Marasmius crinis-equi]|uniref:Uncharacterized protein n=1 Tax=Marasmius crinis-equi TaxID=585013 RepID=A0ABR3FC19_9AGAR